MRMLGRTAMVLGLACLSQAPSLAAQSIIGFDSFKWYIGAQGGVTIFETPNQTKGGIFTAGGHFLVTARRTGLLIEVQEGFKNNQLSSYHNLNAPPDFNQVVRFNNIRRYSASILVFPFKTIAQPYVGIGFGLLQTVNEYPEGTFANPISEESAREIAGRAGSHTFGMFTGGVQVRLANFAVFGQYQITSAPGWNVDSDRGYGGHLLEGPTHSITGGLRISLGSSKEGDGSAVAD